MTMHTPGPWVIHPTAHHPAVRSVGTAEVGPKRICTVGTMTGSKVDIANAALIAAAPDLLAALQAMVNYANLGAYQRADAFNAAHAAIAKAGGAA